MMEFRKHRQEETAYNLDNLTDAYKGDRPKLMSKEIFFGYLAEDLEDKNIGWKKVIHPKEKDGVSCEAW